MLRQALFLLIICSATYSFIDAEVEMGCGNRESNKLMDKIKNAYEKLACNEKKYCCKHFETKSNYCCDADDYVKNQFNNNLTALNGVVAILIVLIVCISCYSCHCCPWYRRRHRGAVLGIQGPSVVQIIQTPGNIVQIPPAQPEHTAYAYPANQMAMPYPPGQAPSQHTTEANGKEAPPNYAQ